MANGYRYVVSGDPVMERDTIYSILSGQGFTVTPTTDWSAEAERGSRGASLALGALAGSNQHLKLRVECSNDGQGNLLVSVFQGTSGLSGGLIGKSQADSTYGSIYRLIADTFRHAQVLLHEQGV